MRLNLNRKMAVAAVAVAASAFAGGAYAASTSNSSTRQTFLNDAAKRLGLPPQRLKDALAGALQDQLNSAVKSGKLNRAQADAIEQRFKQSGGLPLPVGPQRGLHAFGGPRFRANGGPLGAAAHYLGLSVPQLLNQLAGGKSLAQVASSKGKSTSGLENAIVSDERAQLEKARAAGRISSSQEQQLLSRLQARVKDLVNRTGPPRFGHRLPPGPGGPPSRGDEAVPAPAPGGFGPPPPPAGLS
jgi:hypothetical protein